MQALGYRIDGLSTEEQEMKDAVLYIKIDQELKDRISAQAEAEYRTLTDLATQAILQYLEGATNG